MSEIEAMMLWDAAETMAAFMLWMIGAAAAGVVLALGTFLTLKIAVTYTVRVLYRRMAAGRL